MDREPRIIRPLNMMPGTPGRGSVEVRLVNGRKLVVVQAMGRLFMGAYDDPFRALEGELARHALGATVHAIVIDLHAEATSEKMAIGHFVAGRASAVIGTHTHVPTADAWILPGGTAYITDVGMTGDYDSVIGMEKSVSLQRFRSHVPGPRNTPALGEATLCAVYLETDDRTGLASRIEPLRLGGRLAAALGPMSGPQ
jgi:metallophosphoesterase (TIGR00282 family)